MRARMISAIVIATMVGSSAFAAVPAPTTSAEKLSVVRNARVGAKMKRSSSLAGATLAVVVLAAAAGTLGLIAAVDGKSGSK